VATYQAVLEALADGTRREILEQLAERPAAVSELAARLPVSRPAVSQHLRVLLDAGLVGFHEEGTRNVYRLERAGFEELRAWLDGFWQDVLDRFEAYARGETT
jgi:DNA-binding transcriptional ArsR family regulator